MSRCEHLDQVRDVTPGSTGCEECLALGDEWVHLRLCLSCGHVGCCDDSKNRHATRHFESSRHPIIRSFEPGEDWGWCYLDRVGLSFAGAGRAPAREEARDADQARHRGGRRPAG